MLSETLADITQVGMVVFIVGSIAAMGLSLTVDRIVAPLRDMRIEAGRTDGQRAAATRKPVWPVVLSGALALRESTR